MSEQDDAAHTQDLITIYKRRLQELEKQAAFSGITVDPSITLEIQDTKAKIEALKKHPTIPPNSVTRLLHNVIVDLSHHQNDWDRFTNFASDPALRFSILRTNLLDHTHELNQAAVLILALPRRSLFTPEEVDYLDQWVWQGGGLFLLGHYAPIHHETDPNTLAERFGFNFENTLLMPEDKLANEYCRDQPRSFDPDLAIKITYSETNPHPILRGITHLAYLSSCSIRTFNPEGRTDTLLRIPATSGVMTPQGRRDGPHGFMPLIDRWELTSQTDLPVLAITHYGEGRVVVSGSLKICTLQYEDNTHLVKNIVGWLAEPRSESAR
jgi:hypothetical protein